MINLALKVPRQVYVACSGGVDSMAAVSFLLKGKRDVELLFFNHNTPTSNIAEEFLSKWSKDNGLNLHLGHIGAGDIEKGRSQEDYWREKRYSFFGKFTDRNIVTCHHLNDQMEQWLMTSVKGNPRLIPHTNGNIIRPFVLTPKDELVNWAKRNSVPWVEDMSNLDTKYQRNFTRHILMPQVLALNSGFEKTIRKKVLEMI